MDSHDKVPRKVDHQKKKKNTNVEVIDLIMSSFPVPESINDVPFASPNARSSSVNYVSDDENQVRVASQ
jgi:hypothetical protein